MDAGQAGPHLVGELPGLVAEPAAALAPLRSAVRQTISPKNQATISSPKPCITTRAPGAVEGNDSMTTM